MQQKVACKMPVIVLYSANIESETLRNRGIHLVMHGDIPKNTQIDQDHSRTLIRINPAEPITIIETQCLEAMDTFLEAQEVAAIVNRGDRTELEIELEEGAILQHVQLLRLLKMPGVVAPSPVPAATLHRELKVTQQSKSQYHHTLLAFDSSYRIKTELHLKGEHAAASVRALLPLKEKQEITLCITTQHHHEQTESSIQVRGLAKDFAKLDFSGKIEIDKLASGSEARLENKNLLLSETAEIMTRPLLEVNHDNIQCSHGATVGQLDQDALFYLQSRGVSKVDATLMLIQAFVQPVLQDIPAVLLPILEKSLYAY